MAFPKKSSWWKSLPLKRLWRRFQDALGFAFYAFAMVLVVVSGGAAYSSVVASGWSADAAAWVQAAGAIAAIAGATWVAQTEVRRLRRARRELNEEAAWHVRFALVQAQVESQIVAAELLNRDKPITNSNLREWKQRATVSAVALTAFLTRTDPIHPAVTHVLSNAKVLIDGLVDDIEILERNVRAGTEPDAGLVEDIVSPHWSLLELVKLFDARMRGVRIALDEGADGLPMRNWPEWSEDASGQK